MNPHPYYQYPMPVAPGVQAIPGQLPAHYVTAQTAAAATVGGMHYGLPPPPPPNALTMTPSKPLIGPTQKIHDFSKAPVEVNDVNVTAQEESDTESAEKCSLDPNESKQTFQTADSLYHSTVTASAASASTSSLMRGVYPSAYVQSPLSQLSTVSAATAINPGASAAATPYMLSPGMSLPHSSKVVYLPSSGLSGTSGYLSSPGVASNPTIVMDQAGRQYIINNPSYNAPMQYQVAAPSAYKHPLSQQYVLASPQYMNNLHGQTGAALQPVLNPVQGLVPTQTASSLHGVPQNPGGVAPQMYYYY